MNFLSVAANKLKNTVMDHYNSPETPMGRMAQTFGLTGPTVDTPQSLANPDQFARGMEQVIRIPGAESAAATPEQERFATQNGFRNYGEMVAWSKQRQLQREPQTVGRPSNGAPADGSGERVGPSIMHPRNMFDWIRNKISGATGND